jgi:uncharacterized protein
MASNQSKELVDLFKPSGTIAADPQMKDAKTLLLEFLAAVTHGQDAGALFAEDGALELPFLHSVGIPWRHRGRQAIRELQDSLAGIYLDLAFKPEDTHVLIDTPEQVFAEYMAHTTAKATGHTLHHMFAARLVAENGLIKLVRESLNVVAAAQALLPGGVKDLPDPEKRSSRSPRTTGAEAATLKYESREIVVRKGF